MVILQNFQVPLCVIIAWIMGIRMDLNFNLLETSSFAISVVVVAFTLQVKMINERSNLC